MKRITVTDPSKLKKGDLFTDAKGIHAYKVKEITIAPSTGAVYIETREGKVFNATKEMAAGGLFKIKP